MPTATIPDDSTVTTGCYQHTIPLSRIAVPNGFNPRGPVLEDKTLEQLADSMRRHGCLQPIRVRATETGDYLLIAGERRYRAAVKASLMELPVIIRPAGSDEEDDDTAVLIEAVLENDLRVDLDPRARARGYQRMLDTGLTIKGVAERCSTTQARIREHLKILTLNDPVQRLIADGKGPVKAVKALAALALIHPALAERAASEILHALANPEHDIAWTWADLDRDALQVALNDDSETPAGVYRAFHAYPVETFTLTSAAAKQLAAIEKLTGRRLTHVRFDGLELEQGRALGAAHGTNWNAVIVGQPIADQLAADHIARILKRERDGARARAAVTVTSSESVNPSGENPAGHADAEITDEQARQAERHRQREQRRAATTYNLELGRAVYGALSKVKIDERVLKILASIDVCGDLDDIAHRGARYGFPGWVTEARTRSGEPKHEYIDEKAELRTKASTYLAGAHTAGEIAGRQLALITMAVFADQDAVAQSRRGWATITPRGPWADECGPLLDALLVEKLTPTGKTLLAPALEQRAETRAAAVIRAQQQAEARSRIDAVRSQITDLDANALDTLEHEIAVAYGPYDPVRLDLVRAITTRRNQLDGIRNATDHDHAVADPANHS